MINSAQVEYHGQLEDLETSEAAGSFAGNEFREVETPAKNSFEGNDLARIKSGDHLFVEDESLIRSVPILEVGKSAKISKKRSEGVEPRTAAKSAATRDHLAEVDRQYFGAMSSDGPRIENGSKMFLFSIRFLLLI